MRATKMIEAEAWVNDIGQGIRFTIGDRDFYFTDCSTYAAKSMRGRRGATEMRINNDFNLHELQKALFGDEIAGSDNRWRKGKR